MITRHSNSLLVSLLSYCRLKPTPALAGYFMAVAAAEPIAADSGSRAGMTIAREVGFLSFLMQCAGRVALASE